jgi:hypothetical protein
MSKIEAANFSDVQARTEERMFIAAKSVLLEDPNVASHANRVKMANAILNGTTNKLVIQMAKFVLVNTTISAAIDSFMAANPGATVEQGYMRSDVVPDSDMDFEIAGEWTTLANATAGA